MGAVGHMTSSVSYGTLLRFLIPIAIGTARYVCIGLVCLSVVVSGCATTGRAGSPHIETTMLSSVDLHRMTDQMVESILASDTDFSSAVVVTDRVVNQTNHIMDAGEKELFLRRLRASLSQVDSLREMGIVFVARPDEMSVYSGRPEHYESGSGPTHALTATFYTLTNVDRTIRTDAYECTFQLQDLRTREVVWEDAYAVKYVVERGRFE